MPRRNKIFRTRTFPSAQCFSKQENSEYLSVLGDIWERTAHEKVFSFNTDLSSSSLVRDPARKITADAGVFRLHLSHRKYAMAHLYTKISDKFKLKDYEFILQVT